MSSLLTSKKARTVRNADTFKNELTKLSDAAIGVIFIRTREPYRCQETLYEWALSQKKDFKAWTILTGWQEYPQPGTVHTDPTTQEQIEVDPSKPLSSDKILDLGKALAKVKENFPEDGCYVVVNGHHWIEHPGNQQFLKQHVQDALNCDKRLVFIVPDSVKIPQDIEDDIYIMDFKSPSHRELKAIWKGYKDDLENDCLSHFTQDDVDVIIQNSVGMTALEFDTALSIAFVENRERLSSKSKNKLTAQDFIDVIMKSKVEVIKKTDILELMQPAKMTEIGGLDALKHWLTMRGTAFTEEAKEFGVDKPKGMLVVGPPGCGKSLVGKATANVLKIPCLKFDIGKVFGQFVGQSESRMRQALSHVEAMAPCVLLIDEVDKGLGGMGGGGDSGTTSRVFGTLLTWLQERNNDDAPIFVILTANNIVGLPPELMRRGRLDEIFAVTFPNEEERKQIIKIHATKRGHALKDSEYAEIAKHCKDFVGAELEAIVKDAITTCFYNKEKKLTMEQCIQEAKTIVPLSKAFAEKVNAMNEWAKANAKPASTGAKFEIVPVPQRSSTIPRQAGASSIRKKRINKIKGIDKGLTDN